LLVQTKQESIDQQRRIARMLKSLARTPQSMLLARIQQLVNSFADIHRELVAAKAALQAAIVMTRKNGLTFSKLLAEYSKIAFCALVA
jgi:Mg2+ and Co2+ transporter CorA